MDLTVAVIGSGRMGTFLGNQLPNGVKKILIDKDEAKARALASKTGGLWSISMEAAKDADVIAIVLPAGLVNDATRELVSIAKDGSVIINMATADLVEEKIIKANPALHFVDAKIIGNAKVMALGFPSCVMVGTDNEEIFQKIRYILPGYTNVLMGDPGLVPIINTIGSTEAIRAALAVRNQLKELHLPGDLEDTVIHTVCAGTMIAYVQNDLGQFGLELVEIIRREGKGTEFVV